MSEHYNLLLFTLFKMKEDKSNLTGFAFLLCAPPFPPKTVSALVLTQLYGSLCTRHTVPVLSNSSESISYSCSESSKHLRKNILASWI